MYLSVVPTAQTMEIHVGQWLSTRISADTPGIGRMRLFDSVVDAGVLRLIAVGEMDVGELCFGSVVHLPTHNAHHGGIAQTGTTSYL